jgi:hypothetical protein
MTHPQPETAAWPDLPWHAWEPTVTTVHRWLQVVGRVRMVLTPRQPHWGHVPLTVMQRSLSTGEISHAGGAFRIDLDFVNHRLAIVRHDRATFELPLEPMSVARFYSTLLAALADLGIEVAIPTAPAEDAAGTPLDRDEEHQTYEPVHATAMWHGFVEADRLLRRFRRSRRGWTPARLFWGSLDLATSRFAGDGERAVEQTVGWWPTSEVLGPAFYAYTKPEPPHYRLAPLPSGGSFDPALGEYILTWDDALATVDPAAAAAAFFGETARAGRVARGAAEG